MKGGAGAKPLVWAGAALVGATVLVAGMVVFAVGPFSSTTPPPPAPPKPDVEIVNYSYSPRQLTVKAGTSVSWLNLDAVEHTVTVGAHGGGHAGSIDSGLMGQGQRFNYTFDTPGTYEYHCDPHPTMLGTVNVTA